jgi:hypothetical protein
MTDYSENGESHVSDADTQGDELLEAVEEAVDDWVSDDSIEAYRKNGYLVMEEKKLVEYVSVMVAVAMREAAE